MAEENKIRPVASVPENDKRRNQFLAAIDAGLDDVKAGRVKSHQTVKDEIKQLVAF